MMRTALGMFVILAMAAASGCSATGSVNNGGGGGGEGDSGSVPTGDVIDESGDAITADGTGDSTGPRPDGTGPDGTGPGPDGTGPGPDGTSPDGMTTFDNTGTPDGSTQNDTATDLPAGGAVDCKGIFACWDTCGETDDACVEACITGAEPSAQTELNDLEQCAKTNCSQFNPNAGQALEFQACFRSKCAPEVEKCLSGGTGTCPDLFTCLGKCGQSDATCQNNCVEDASLGAQSAFLNVQVCAKTNKCTAQACVDQKCQAEVQACGAI